MLKWYLEAFLIIFCVYDWWLTPFLWIISSTELSLYDLSFLGRSFWRYRGEGMMGGFSLRICTFSSSIIKWWQSTWALTLGEDSHSVLCVFDRSWIFWLLEVPLIFSSVVLSWRSSSWCYWHNSTWFKYFIWFIIKKKSTKFVH